MSIRYTIDKLREMRANAALGTLSLGVCAISGELVSSTPIPGSKCGMAGQNTADYGGYLLGEGMTPAAALYLANLHNWFPTMAEAIPETADPQGDSAYIRVIQGVAESHGWNVWEDSLSEWLRERLSASVVPESLTTQSRPFQVGDRVGNITKNWSRGDGEILAIDGDSAKITWDTGGRNGWFHFWALELLDPAPTPYIPTTTPAYPAVMGNLRLTDLVKDGSGMVIGAAYGEASTSPRWKVAARVKKQDVDIAELEALTRAQADRIKELEEERDRINGEWLNMIKLNAEYLPKLDALAKAEARIKELETEDQKAHQLFKKISDEKTALLEKVLNLDAKARCVVECHGRGALAPCPGDSEVINALASALLDAKP